MNRVIVLSAVVAATACNALVGVEDVSLRGSGGASGSAGTGASGGNNSAGGSTAHAGSSGKAGSSAAGSHSAAGESSGGAAGENTGGSADAGAAGETTVGGTSGSGGSGGATVGGNGGAAAGGSGGGTAGSGGASCAAALPKPTPLASPMLTLLQATAVDAARGGFAFSADTKQAYISSWSSHTIHYTRSATTGLLTTGEDRNWGYNLETNFLSPDSSSIYISGVNGLQFYSVSLGASGALPATLGTQSATPGYARILNWLQVVGTTYLATANDAAGVFELRSFKNGVYSAQDAIPSLDKPGLTGLARTSDYLYWAANKSQTAGGKIGRTALNCDGSLGASDSFSDDIPGEIDVCESTQRLYVTHADHTRSLVVYDLSKCTSNFASCTPTKVISSTDVPALYSGQGVSLAPDCSALYVGALGAPPAQGQAGSSALVVFSLANPDAPTKIQEFDAGQTYDSVDFTAKLGGGFLRMKWVGGFFYAPNEFGSDVFVFGQKP